MQDLINLRSFLEVDQVNLCQFQPADRALVIAEARHPDRLPSLLSSSFPLEDLVPPSYERLLQFRICAMVNVARKTVFHILPATVNLGSAQFETMMHLPEASSLLHHLTDRGVLFYLVMPIFYQGTASGLLMAYHSEVSFLSTRKLEVLHRVANQLSVTITQPALRQQAQAQADPQEAIIHRVTTLLQASAIPDFQTALETTVAAFQGSGGRLWMSPQGRTASPQPANALTAYLAASSPGIRAYTWGVQSVSPTELDAQLMAHYRRWRDQHPSGHYPIWAIANLYQTPELQPLLDAFRPTPFHSLLIIPLVYRQQLLGYLGVFRNAVASHASPPEWVHPQQRAPEPAWPHLDLAQTLGTLFAMAIYEHELLQQMQHSQTHFHTERQRHTTQLEQVAQQQQGLSDLLARIQATSDLDTIFRSITRELCHLLQAERMSVYRFNADWGGQFIHDFAYAAPTWRRTSKLGHNTAWNDTYLQDSQGGRYRYNETYVVDDIYQAELSSCHLEILEQFHIKAFATAPVFIGHRLWGVLAAYQHAHSRQWTTTDVLFLRQTATALGLALQHAEFQAQSHGTPTDGQNMSTDVHLGGNTLP